MSQDNEGEEESNEESSSEEESEAASLSTESSRDEEDYSDEEKISSDEEDVLSMESQMSILTPIAEESVTSPGNGHTSDDSSSSSEDDSISDDLENGENSINDQSEQDETASPNNVSQNGSTGAEAMLTDMPDENSIALAKRKAVQNVMTNKSLTAIERNKRIQDIMAGKVELPKVPTTSSQNLSNETTDSFQEASGSKAGIDASQNGQRKENRSSKKKSSENGGTNGLAKKIEPSTISVAKEKPTRKMKISFGSTRNIISPQHTVQSQCSIFEFDNNVDQKNQVELMKVFQDTLSLAESSTDKSSDQKALLTAMTYTLHELDSQWNLGTFSTSPKSNLVHKSMKCTLGKRERISPYSDHLITRGDDPVNWKSLFVGITPGSTQPRTQKKTSFDLPVKINRRTCDSIENMIKKPRKPSRELTRATFDIKKSAVIEKISMNLLLEPPSDDEESDDDTGQNIGKLHKWFTSITKLDPRWQIRSFFDDASTSFDNTDMFTVWRPTSFDAIKKMMVGEGVGKGLEIKGKSAKCGLLSGYVPFLQIHEESHKPKVRIFKGDRTKLFFQSREARNTVGKRLGKIAKDMALRTTKAKFALAKMDETGASPDEEEMLLLEIDRYEVENSEVTLNDDDYAPERYGVEVSCRVLWETLVIPSDITREANSDLSTGRGSQPSFQDMNFATLRKQDPRDPIPVLFQFSRDAPFDPRTLIIAYEEEGRVTPVVSDFDCFLMGTRDFPFKESMPEDQIELLDWCVSQIEWVLETQNVDNPGEWTSRWLQILKHAARNGFVYKMPKFGFGDPASYALIEAAVHRSKKTNGAVRHGPECFNYFFPQDLDDELLIIFPGEQRWRYVTVPELQDILIQKIRRGYTVPLNPKWILYDPGWINVFIELLKSKRPSVQASMNMWYPPNSGLRERIIEICKKYPYGFDSGLKCDESMSLAVQEYERFIILQRARHKLKGFMVLRNLHTICKERTEREQRALNIGRVVSAKNVAKALKRQSIIRIEKETVDSIRNAVLFDDGDFDSRK